MSNRLFFYLKHSDAKVLTKGSHCSDGYDLYSCEDVVIKAHEHELVNIGITVFFPFGACGRIGSRSGLSLPNGIEVGPGIINFSKSGLTMTKGIELDDKCVYYNYEGIIKVIIHNHSDSDYQVAIGDRIAQLFVVKLEYCNIEVESIELLESQNNTGV